MAGGEIGLRIVGTPAEDSTRAPVAVLARRIERIAGALDTRVREGKFQRWLALIAGLSSGLTGLEVGYLHYRGSYSRRVMYTPVILSTALAGAGVWAFVSRRAANRILPAVATITLADCVIGFYFHVRGIHRKPGGWRMPVTNIMMGPPIFAPLLFGTSAYLGLVASFLARDDYGDDGEDADPQSPQKRLSRKLLGFRGRRSETQLRTGHFQRHLAAVAAVSAFCSGTEALYSHYRSNFRYKAQWTPVIVAPALVAAGVGAVRSPRVARTWLPAASGAAMLNGAVGFGYHARGIRRRPGGSRMLVYNVLHGPPILAPLLFAAAGFIGMLASLMRREEA